MGITSSDKIADYILCYFHERGDNISNLKLQKLVYYAQGWFLGLHTEPLFKEEIQAWVRGPVQPRLYQRFKKFSYHPIDEDPDCPDFADKRVKPLIDYILDLYGDYSPTELEKMTHQEPPWITARRGLKPNDESEETITHKSMREFFEKRAKEEEAIENRIMLKLSEMHLNKDWLSEEEDEAWNQ
jgi:uncharacterized phage-associated protein